MKNYRVTLWVELDSELEDDSVFADAVTATVPDSYVTDWSVEETL